MRNPGNILGTLGVDGAANLFLMNPNGILFGQNARLNVRGSFVSTTGEAIKFSDDNFFSAKNNQSTPLLTISIPIGLQFGANPGKIFVQGDGRGLRTASDLIDTTNALRVEPNKTLAFVGGDVSLEGGTLKTAGGRIEIGSVKGASFVDLTPVDKGFTLSYASVKNFGNIQLTGLATVDASGEGAGDVNIWGRQITLSDGSNIEASTLGSEAGGSLVVNAIDLLEITGVTPSNQFGSGLYALVYSDGTGNAGNLTVNTANLVIKDGGTISSYTEGAGKTGNLTINASNKVELIGTSVDAKNYSNVIAEVKKGANGDSGDLTINTGNLVVRDGAYIATRNFGAGKTGDLIINAKDTIELIGSDSINKGSSGLSADFREGATGTAGNIKVQARNIFLKEGGDISSSTFGKGDSGDISITARDIYLDRADIINNVQSREAEGNAGKISIITGSLTVTNGAQINSFTRGKGNAGDITIQALDAVSFDGVDNEGNYSGSFSNVQAGAVGNGGNIDITAESLSLTNGAKLAVNVREASDTTLGGQGRGGTISVDVRDTLTISGQNNSSIFASLGSGAVGRGGDIKVQARNILIKEGGDISSSTFGKGDSGDISITASDIFLDKGDIINNVQSREAEGNAGKISITTGSLTLTNGSQINSFTRGKGNAGNITIQAVDAVSFDGMDNEGNYSGSYSNVQAGAVGNGGSIDITAESLSLTNGAKLAVNVREASDTTLGGQGRGGTISVNVRDALTISGQNESGIFASLGSGAVGRGGDIKVQAGNILIKEGGDISSSTFGKGDSGDISITASDIFLDKGDIINNVQSREAEGNAGKISITTGSLTSTNGSQINSFTRGKGNAGNITIQAVDAVSFDGMDNEGNYSGSYSNVQAGAVGNGGSIDITAESLSLINGAELAVNIRGASDTTLGGQGRGGTINVNVRDALTISGQNESGIFASLGSGAVGRGGDIKVQARNIFIKDEGNITSSTSGKGDSGNVFITARDEIFLNQGYISSNVRVREAEGNAGNVDITTGSLQVTNGAQINSFTRGQGNGGSVTIQALDAVSFDGIDSSQFPSASFSDVDAGAVGNGGSVKITAESLSLTNGAGLGVGVGRQSTTLPGGQGIGGTVDINVRDLTISGTDSGVFASLGAGAIGRGGNIKVQAQNVSIGNGGLITTLSNGQGKAGDIDINANTASLNNGQIIAQTASSDGGNINLNLSQYLLLRNNSQISTTAGTAQAGGNGGNININTRFIAASKRENSDISANAFSGKGGNVNIRAQGIFGIEARAKESPLSSDITASSETGVQGQISISQPDIEPAQGLIELPEEVVDASNQIGQICPKGAYAKRPLGEFTITGRGSFPPNPLQPMTGSTSTLQLAILEQAPSVKQPNIISSPVPTSTIVEAQAWVKDAWGEIFLVERAPDVTHSKRAFTLVCPSSSL